MNDERSLEELIIYIQNTLSESETLPLLTQESPTTSP
jgi:hypothetical protein